MASRPLPLLLGLGSAAAFAAFPLVRPWGDKSGDVRAMAEAFASPGWVIAHSSGMFAWVLLAAALATLAGADRWPRRSAWAAAVGAAAVLPYYGAETFGLHGLARAALDEGNLPLVWAAQELVRGDVRGPQAGPNAPRPGHRPRRWRRVTRRPGPLVRRVHPAPGGPGR